MCIIHNGRGLEDGTYLREVNTRMTANIHIEYASKIKLTFDL
jgi:hypothetical protein